MMPLKPISVKSLRTEFDLSISGAILLQKRVDKSRSNQLGKIGIRCSGKYKCNSVTIHIYVAGDLFFFVLGCMCHCYVPRFFSVLVYELTEQFEVQTVLSAHNT